MNIVDVALTIINVILVIISGIGSYKSVKYFQKSRNLTIYVKTDQALIEIEKMLMKLREALQASSNIKGKRGFSLNNTLSDIGQELDKSLSIITSNIPVDYYDKFHELQNQDNFNLQIYINSFISGEVIKENGIDSETYYICQERLFSMQKYLKKCFLEIGDKLK